MDPERASDIAAPRNLSSVVLITASPERSLSSLNSPPKHKRAVAAEGPLLFVMSIACVRNIAQTLTKTSHARARDACGLCQHRGSATHARASPNTVRPRGPTRHGARRVPGPARPGNSPVLAIE